MMRRMKVPLFAPVVMGKKIRYLLRDEFSTPLTSGNVNGTSAEPGAGTRGVVQNDGTISIASGKLIFTTQSTATIGDLVFFYTEAISRANGITLVAKRKIESGTGLMTTFGFCTDKTGSAASRRHCFQFNSTGVDIRGDASVNSVGDSASDLTVKIILKSAGATYYINGVQVGDYSSLTNTPLYFVIANSTGEISFDYIRIYT